MIYIKGLKILTQGIALFATSLIILHETAGTTQWTSSPQPLQCKSKADLIHLEILINTLEAWNIIGVIWMVLSSPVLYLTCIPSYLSALGWTSHCCEFQYTIHLKHSLHTHPTSSTTKLSKKLNNKTTGELKTPNFYCIFALSFYSRNFGTVCL